MDRDSTLNQNVDVIRLMEPGMVDMKRSASCIRRTVSLFLCRARNDVSIITDGFVDRFVRPLVSVEVAFFILVVVYASVLYWSMLTIFGISIDEMLAVILFLFSGFASLGLSYYTILFVDCYIQCRDNDRMISDAADGDCR